MSSLQAQWRCDSLMWRTILTSRSATSSLCVELSLGMPCMMVMPRGPIFIDRPFSACRLAVLQAISDGIVCSSHISIERSIPGALGKHLTWTVEAYCQSRALKHEDKVDQYCRKDHGRPIENGADTLGTDLSRGPLAEKLCRSHTVDSHEPLKRTCCWVHQKRNAVT